MVTTDRARERTSAFIADRGAWLLLALAVSADIAFIGLHTVASYSRILSSPLFDIEFDNSYAEMFQYIKFLWIALLLASLALRTRTMQYLAWSLLFAFLLLDDAVSIHEGFGRRIAPHLTFVPDVGLRHQDFAELIVMAAAAAILLPLLAWAYRTGTKAFRNTSRDLLVLLAVLLVFGVAFDLLHSALRSYGTLRFLAGVIEDGGEMLATSLLLWYAFLLLVHGDRHDRYLHT